MKAITEYSSVAEINAALEELKESDKLDEINTLKDYRKVHEIAEMAELDAPFREVFHGDGFFMEMGRFFDALYKRDRNAPWHKKLWDSIKPLKYLPKGEEERLDQRAYEITGAMNSLNSILFDNDSLAVERYASGEIIEKINKKRCVSAISLCFAAACTYMRFMYFKYMPVNIEYGISFEAIAGLLYLTSFSRYSYECHNITSETLRLARKLDEGLEYKRAIVMQILGERSR